MNTTLNQLEERLRVKALTELNDELNRLFNPIEKIVASVDRVSIGNTSLLPVEVLQILRQHTFTYFQDKKIAAIINEHIDKIAKFDASDKKKK